MQRNQIFQFALLLLCVRLAPGQVAPAPAADSPGLDELKKQYEPLFTALQVQERDSDKILRQRYLDSLSKLEDALQAAGNQLPAVLAVHGERERFKREGAVSDSALSADQPALRKLQEAWRAQAAAWPREHAQQVIAASERYLKCLATLQKELQARNDTNGVAAVKASKERLLGSKLVLEALELLQSAKSGAPSSGGGTAAPEPAAPAPTFSAAFTFAEVGEYKFYPRGKEPSARNLQSFPLDFPAADRHLGQADYELRAGVVVDRAARSVTPRLSLSARNRDIPAGAKLVLDYFIRTTGHFPTVSREKTETLVLPKIARGQACTVDSKGVSLAQYFYLSSSLGRDFYGLIVSLFDEGGKLLFQQCGPPALSARCDGAKPE